MKSKYQDNLGYWHDTTDADSNNRWIYTAIGKHLGFGAPDTIIRDQITCFSDSQHFWMDRWEGQEAPPISRDEMLAMISLLRNKNLLFLLEHYNFNMSYHGDKSLWVAIKALWKIRNEHRNYAWKNNITEAYRLAFQLLPHDRYCIKKAYGKRATALECVMFHLYFITTLLKRNTSTGNISAKNVLWVQLRDINSKWLIKLVNYKKNIVDYFGDEHDFSKKINKE